MAYVALYRKYRSQSFSELIGQDAITTTLQNAIRSGRLAHAYLFYGARGCGKTSTARLLARALNCQATPGPNPEPCGVCPLCVSIREGSCLDVTEIDAASETGIDDVREKIIENVQYSPAEGRYKVYIIDEVHDLSAKAFDALLKTLEEPPAHVVFILATTELHKVPITIRSRCQPYQFKRGSIQDLALAVQNVLDGENCTAEPEAVIAVARAAEGSWRDALSLLEQAMAYSNGTLTAETVQSALGVVGTEHLIRVTETLATNSWDATLAIAGELLESGLDARQLITALTGHLRDLMLVASGAIDAAAQELGAERVERLKGLVGKFTPDILLKMMDELARAERDIRFTNQQRWLLERTLLRIMPANIELEKRVPALPQAAVPIQPQQPPSRPVARDDAYTPRAPKPVSPPVVPDADDDLTPTSPSRFAEPINLEVIQKSWPLVLKRFAKVSPQGSPYLSKASVHSLDNLTLVLHFSDSFACDRIQKNEKGRALAEKTINETLSVTGYKIKCLFLGNGTSPVLATRVEPEENHPSLMEMSSEVTQTKSSLPADNELVETDQATSTPAHLETTTTAPPVPKIGPFTKSVLEIFDGEIVE